MVATTSAPAVSSDDYRLASKRAGQVFGALVGLFLVVAAFVWVQMRPPIVRLDASLLTVERGLRSTSRSVATIRSVSLDSSALPVNGRVRAFAFGQSKRGRFRIHRNELADLYITLGRPPYVRVESSEPPLFINFDDPAQTLALYARLRRELPAP